MNCHQIFSGREHFSLLCKRTSVLIYSEHLCTRGFLFFLCYLFIFLSFCHFLGRSRGIWSFPGYGSNRSCTHWPTPEPQQRGIRAAFASYTTAQGNAGSLTHWARTGNKPVSSWMLVRLISAEPRWELPIRHILKKFDGIMKNLGNFL